MLSPTCAQMCPSLSWMVGRGPLRRPPDRDRDLHRRSMPDAATPGEPRAACGKSRGKEPREGPVRRRPGAGVDHRNEPPELSAALRPLPKHPLNLHFAVARALAPLWSLGQQMLGRPLVPTVAEPKTHKTISCHRLGRWAPGPTLACTTYLAAWPKSTQTPNLVEFLVRARPEHGRVQPNLLCIRHRCSKGKPNLKVPSRSGDWPRTSRPQKQGRSWANFGQIILTKSFCRARVHLAQLTV